MIDHHEQHCRQILIDELEATRPSLAIWAFAEFDLGMSAAEVRGFLFFGNSDAVGLREDADAVVGQIDRDESGELIGMLFTGNGNGGNISRDTLKANGRLKLRINSLPKPPKKG